MTDSSPAESAPLYRTTLAENPLPEVLVKIDRYRVPGVLEMKAAERTARIYTDAGVIVYATSSEKSDSLLDWLLARGTINQGQYDDCERRHQSTGHRIRAVLIESGTIDALALIPLLREYVQSVFVSLFGWAEGEVAFRPGRDLGPDALHLKIPISPMIVAGARAIQHAKPLIDRMGGPLAIVRRNEEVDDSFLSDEERNLFLGLESRLSLMEAAKLPPLSQSENAKILYGLYALEMISIKPPKQIKVQLKVND